MLTGDARHLSAFPPFTAAFLGAAVCRLYNHVTELGLRPNGRRTGNFPQLARYIVMPKSGHAAVYLQLPTEQGFQGYVAFNRAPWMRPCAPESYAEVVSWVDETS